MASSTTKRSGAPAYLMFLGGAIALFMVIRWRGEQLIADPSLTGARFSAEPVAHGGAAFRGVLLALVAVLAAARVLSAVMKWFRQPPVVGEIIAGLLLGPSLLGRFAPQVSHFIFPPSVVTSLAVIAQIGVVLYMFLVGLEVDFDALRGHGRASLAISGASITVPFLSGSLIALYLYPRLSTRDVPFTIFALFLGVSMSVTAFPVLARILTDRGIQSTKLGTLALTCAAMGDVAAWCLLALVEGVAQSRMEGIFVTLVLVGVYLGFMLAIVRPFLGRMIAALGTDRPLTQPLLGALCIALLLSAITTEAIGIHALFGAFFLGVLIPHDSALARDLRRRFEELVVVLFLPAFFAFTGLRAEIGLVSGLEQWLICGLIVIVASLGKFVGTAVAARASGLAWRDAGALGILMNTRGLMELIVLNVGLDMGVISPTLFTMLVLMAVVTTIATTPLLLVITEKNASPEPSAAVTAAG